MRYLKTILFMTFIVIGVLNAQSPLLFKYQGAARKIDGVPLSNQSVSLRITILESSPSGSAVFMETHTATTNDMGVFHVNIGQGLILLGNISSVNWGNNAHFMKVELDENGGNNYQDMGVSQLLSVPYALHSASDPSSENELQILSINNDTLSISNGNSVLLAGSGKWIEAGNDIYFDKGNIGLGTSTPNHLLHVNDVLNDQYKTSSRFDIKGQQSQNITYRGVDIRLSGSAERNRALQSWSKGISSGTNVGVAGYADSALINIAVRGYSSSDNTNSNGFNIGFKGNAFSSNYSNIACGAYATTGNTSKGNNFGIVAKATSVTSDKNYAIYSEASNAGSNYAGFFNGDVMVSGNFSQASDENLKTNIKDIDLAIDLISSIRAVSYEHKTGEGVNLSKGKHYGFLAQQVQNVLPELVLENELDIATTDPDTNTGNMTKFLSVKYTEIIPLLVKAIQEQQAQIDMLNRALNLKE